MTEFTPAEADVTGPEQHAATVEQLADIVRDQLADEHHPEDQDDCPFCRSIVALDELVALAGRADELQGRVYAMENMLPGGFLASWEAAEARADELQRERDEAYDKGWEKGRREWLQLRDDYGQARREADQLRDDDAVMRGVAAVRKMLRMRVGDKHAHAEAFRAALAGVQADNKDSA